MIIIIPGACGKIGEAITHHLLKKGHSLILGDTNKIKLKKLKKKIGNDTRVSYYSGDLIKQQSIKRFINNGIKKFGKIDVAVNCLYPKSKNWDQKIGKIKEKDVSNFFSANLVSTLIFAQEIIKIFLKFKKGNLINISSIQGISSPKFNHYKNLKMHSPIQYTATKAAVISITKYLAKLYGEKNIRVNCLSPGGIKDKQNNIFTKRYKSSCSGLKGLLEPRDLNNALEFLIDKSNFINGQNLIVDDGWSL